MVKTQEERLAHAKQKLAQTPVGKDGLKRMGWGDFELIPAHRVNEFIKEPLVLTCEGEDVCVAMNIEDYYSYRQSNPRGLMVRVDGILYRQVI